MEVRFDLHIHSEHSPDGRMSLDEIVSCARAAGLQGVAVCDHDRALTETWDAPDFLLIPGIELSTDQGHLLGLFLTAPIQHTTWKETVQAIHDQGGITVLAHPYQNKRSGSLEPFRPILDDIDAVETWNSRANRKYPHANDNAFILALMRNKLSTGGSDAHVPQEVGRGFLTVDVEERTLAAVNAQILGGYKPEGGRYGGHGKPSSARYVASSQRTKLRKAHAGAGAYAKWGLFSLNCLRQDAARTLRELKQKLPARLPKEFREIEKELENLDDGDDPLL